MLHRNHILPIGSEVQLRSEKTTDPPKPKRRVSKRLKAEGTENCDLPCFPASKHDDKIESASDSEDDEMRVWYDYQAQPAPESKEPEPNHDQSQPFSLDLDLAVPTDKNTEIVVATAQEPIIADEDELLVQDETAEGAVVAERGTETQTTDKTIERRDRVSESPDETRRPQRLRRVPTRLTYDLLGSPTSVVVSIPIATLVKADDKKNDFSLSPVKIFKSTVYKWIG
ncbi:uncharacterized protein LOC114909432 [Xyrichtys novacula]|uniref:Uncharacterized protein LOC114909432 n=1 Tax=Xyrichtys novacula TaxID=13765 RepID=A0AAV1HE14_XYRNO|nr:uncharacterized protein LOC114909432 [Xyrichtys novacula]